MSYLLLRIMCDSGPAWGAFTIRRQGREIYVPTHMNNIARSSSDAFWHWFIQVKHKGNPFYLQVELTDVAEFEKWQTVEFLYNTPSQQDGP